MDIPPEVARDITAFRDAVPWLRSFDRRNSAGRIDVYLSICESLERNSVAAFRDTLALIDMRHLVRIYETRDELVLLGDLKKRMSVALKGAPLYDGDGDGEHEPRNKLFELLSACYIVALGMRITESRDGDLAAQWQGQRVLGECKRQSSAQIRATLDRIGDASAQLCKRRIEHEPGIVFVDLTLAANPELKPYAVTSDEIAKAIARLEMKENAELLHDRAMARLRSPDDICVACHVTFPCWNAPENRWSVHEQWISLPNPRRTALGDVFYQTFSAAAGKMIHR